MKTNKLLRIVALMLVIVCTLSSCSLISLSVSEDGYLVVNGKKTGHQVDYPDTPDNGNEGENDVNIGADSENPLGLLFVLKSDGTYKVEIGAAKYQSKIEIPATYKGKPVTEVGSFGANMIGSMYSIEFNTTLKEIVIPEGVTKLGPGCFAGCINLASVVIPDSVTEICSLAFLNCMGLKSITIGKNVSRIGLGAFMLSEFGRENTLFTLLEVVNRSSMDISIESLIDDSEIDVSVNIHDGESEMVRKGDYLFYTIGEVNYLVAYLGDDVNLVLPVDYNGETYEILPAAFAFNYTVESIIVSDGVKKIGSGAFGYCSNLMSVTIGKNVESIADSIFEEDISLVEIVNNSPYITLDMIFVTSQIIPEGIVLEIHSGESKIKNVNGYNFYTVNGTNYLIKYSGKEKDLVLPESYNGENYEINQFAFSPIQINPFIDSEVSLSTFENSITSVVIPDSVTKIGDHAFFCSIGLSEVIIGSGVTYIGNDAFDMCMLTSVVFKNTKGWNTILSKEKTPVSIPDIDLENPAKAAEYFISGYYSDAWYRSE